MKTKEILVNDKTETAYRIVSTEKTQSVDFSCDPAAGVNPTRERDIYRITFPDRAYEFPLLIPRSNVLTLDNIARLDYELEETDVDVNLLWSSIVFLLPGEKTIKDREVEVEIPYMSSVKVEKDKMRKVKIKVPKGRIPRVQGYDGGLSPIKPLTPEEVKSIDDFETAGRCIFRPLPNWSEVELNGQTISLRNRERAKDFLRLLWDKGATCRSKAIDIHKEFPKPSSLFVPGVRYINKGTGRITNEVPVTSERGALIQRVYKEAVGIVKARPRTGSHGYYLRAFRDSDST